MPALTKFKQNETKQNKDKSAGMAVQGKYKTQIQQIINRQKQNHVNKFYINNTQSQLYFQSINHISHINQSSLNNA